MDISVSDSQSILENTDFNPIPRTGKIQVWISGSVFTDYASRILKNSLVIENILTRQIDRCSFTIRKLSSDGSSYTPVVGKEVIVYDGLTKVFGGIITKLTQTTEANKYVLYEVECDDYGRLLDRFLINDSFENQTVAEIIDYILADKGLDSTFTTNNVNGTTNVKYIAFKYEPMSAVLSQLADLMNYDWYIDYDKDIHFIAKDTESASFDIQDSDGSYLQDSLVIRSDNSQVRNVVFVKGGDYLSDTFTSVIEANGNDFIYPLGYKYSDLTVTLTGQSLDVGVDYLNSADDHDVLWNFQEKILRWKEADKPSSGALIRVGGKPYLPVLIRLKDNGSIESMAEIEGGTGEYEHVIIDNSIDDRDAARDRARAELDSYKDTLSEAEFETYTAGLKAGQRIRVNSTIHDKDEYYVINRVTSTMWTNNEFVYKVSLMTTKTMGVIDFLRNLAERDKKDISQSYTDILDLIESADETMTMIDTFTASIDHNPQTETATISETFTAQSLNYDVQFVLGVYTWGGEGSGDPKRVFILNGSRLG